MRNVIPAALALGLAMGGVAYAQNTTPATGNTSGQVSGAGLAATPAAPANNAPATSPASGTGGAGAANNNNGGGTNAAVSTSSAQPANAPVPGANSFTEGEARSRIADKGFGEVKDLKLDNKGIWRGTATKDGRSVNVALDYQGNVVAQ